MPDINDYLIAAMMNEQEQELLSNPFYTTGRNMVSTPVSSIGTQMSPWETVLAGALQGLGGGMLQGYGESQIDQRNKGLSDAITQYATTDGESKYEILDRPEFSKVAPVARLKELLDGIEEQKLLEKAKLEPPKIITTHDGSMSIDNTWDPVKRALVPMGEPYPRWEPNKEGEALPSDAVMKLAQVIRDAQGTSGPPSEADLALAADPRARGDIIKMLKEDAVQGRFTTDMPTQRKIADKKADVEKFIVDSKNVRSQLAKFDPNEDIVSAVGRAVTAKLIPDSEAADLERVMNKAIFAALKPEFPGSLSDDERKAMTRAYGNQPGVTIGKLLEIYDRAEQSSKDKFDAYLDIQTSERGLDTGVRPYRLSSDDLGTGLSEPPSKHPVGTTGTAKDGSPVVWDGKGWKKQ